jgi:hypothetical protein
MEKYDDVVGDKDDDNDEKEGDKKYEELFLIFSSLFDFLSYF